MAFTGRLGTTDSQPGNIVLGSVGGAAAVEDDFSLDAVVLATQAGSYGVDAVVLATQANSFSIDAVLVVVETDAFDLDSVILASQSASIAADAIVLTTQADSLGIDAFIAETAVVEDFSLDAILRASASATFGVDAYVLGSGHSRLEDHFGTQDDTTITWNGELLSDALDRLFADAFGVSEPSGRFTIGAWIDAYITLGAVLRKEQTGSFGINALVSTSAAFSLNAVIRDVPVVRTAFNAYIIQPG